MLSSEDWLNIRYMLALLILAFLVFYNKVDANTIIAFLGGAFLPVGELAKLLKPKAIK